MALCVASILNLKKIKLNKTQIILNLIPDTDACCNYSETAEVCCSPAPKQKQRKNYSFENFHSALLAISIQIVLLVEDVFGLQDLPLDPVF